MNPPNKPPPWNVPLVLHFEGEAHPANPTGLLVLGYHDGVRWRPDDELAIKDPIGWSLIDAATPKHDPDDLAELLALTDEHAHVNREPWTVKDAIEVVKELAREREAQWNEHDISEGADAAAYKTPEDLAAMFHEAYERLAPSHGHETREASAVPWGEVPEPNRGLMIAVAADVIDRLLRGGS